MYNHFPKKHYYMNLETGEIVTYSQMLQQAAELYDFDDWTNAVEIWEYYEETNIPVQ